MVRLGTNIASLKAQRRLGEASAARGQALERLASGLHINQAADDAAGLAVSSILRADARIYTQAVRNANYGVSLLNVAEGAVSALSGIVARQIELAEQAASGTYSFAQRVPLDREAAALTDEFNRVVRATSFSGRQVLDGVNGRVRLQLGNGVEESLLLAVGERFGHAAGDGTFQNRTAYTAGINSQGVRTGDFNGDGLLDLVTVDADADAVSVLLGNGDGSFGPPAAFAAGDRPQVLSTGDFNGDGILDVVTTDTDANTVSVLLGNGDGSFQARRVASVGTTPGGVATGDFNGDGRLDLATADLNSDTVSLLLGNGDGTFAARATLGTGLSPLGLLAGDFDGDGAIDLVAANANEPSVSVFFGNGDGTFNAHVVVGVGTSPTYVAAGDLNGDGVLDLVVIDQDSTGVRVLLGNGDRTFRSEQVFGTQGSPSAVAVGDVNGDGVADLVTSNVDAASVSVLLGNGDGTFGASQEFGAGNVPTFVALGDFNGDFIADIVTSDGFDDAVSVLLGNADASGRRNNLQAGFDLTTVQGARDALTALATQLDRLGEESGQLGALQSRLEAAVDSLKVRAENFTAAASRITDVDVAQETAQLVRTGILQQAGAAVLAQANQQPALVLRLLKGSGRE
jgi:flagellin-like hook-associated protein FlgL